MARKIKLPKYAAGDTYFLSHKSGTPAKIYIDAVYMKPRSTEWMYAICSEANGGKVVYVPESVLAQRISKHTSPIYNHDDIVKRINSGYRFAGNYNTDEAMVRGEEFARNRSIKSVILYPALDSNCNPLEDMYGVWIKWDHVIPSDSKDLSVILIK